MDAQCLRRQVGIGSKSDCLLLGQPRRIFEISASDVGSKVDKSGGDVNGEDERKRGTQTEKRNKKGVPHNVGRVYTF